MDSAGVDYGVRRIAYSQPKKGIFDELILTDKDDIKSLNTLSEWLKSHIEAGRPELVVVEQSIQGASRNIRTGISMAMVAGALSLTVQQVGLKVILVGPSSWKKAVIGYGNADKDAVTRWLSTRHPKYYEQCQRFKKPQDVTDATCLALYAETILG